MKTKYIYILLLSLLPCVTEAQELTVQSFSLSPSELISTADQRKDLNGTACALVKVQVVDDIVRAEGNVIGGIVNRGTEKWVYLTQGTKTFRIFPKSHLPLTISTGDYHIDELEGKRVYILRLTANGSSTEVAQQEPEIIQQESEPAPVVQPEPAKPEVVQQKPEPTYQEYYTPEAPATPVKPSYSTEIPLHFYGGIGFNALSVMGPSLHLGLRYKSVALEAGFVLGLDKVEDMRFSLSGFNLNEAYDYSCNKAWIRFGVNFDSGQFRITPQAGLTFNMISGKSVSGVNSSTNYFEESNPMSIFAGIRLSYKITDKLFVHLTPQYDFAIGGDQVFDVIKQGDSKIKNWGEGLGANFGLIYEF